MTCFWVKLMMHKIIFLLMLLSSLFYDSLLFARYHGRRAITDISEKTINFINETNFDCLVVAKMYHCPNKTACVSCNLKSNKKHPLSSHDRIMLSYPLPKKTPRSITFKNHALKTNDIYEGYLDGCSVVYVKIQLYDPYAKLWRKTYLKLKNGMTIFLFYDGQSLQTKVK